jgi:hypothetical protein
MLLVARRSNFGDYGVQNILSPAILLGYDPYEVWYGHAVRTSQTRFFQPDETDTSNTQTRRSPCKTGAIIVQCGPE